MGYAWGSRGAYTPGLVVVLSGSDALAGPPQAPRLPGKWKVAQVRADVRSVAFEVVYIHQET